MRRFDPVTGVAAAVLSIATLAACSAPPAVPRETLASAPAPAAVVAPRPPPPKRAEIPPPSPSPQALWTVGHWKWNGARYVWAPGKYVERPSPTANWIDGYWEEQPQGWMWTEGRWTS